MITFSDVYVDEDRFACTTIPHFDIVYLKAQFYDSQCLVNDFLDIMMIITNGKYRFFFDPQLMKVEIYKFHSKLGIYSKIGYTTLNVLHKYARRRVFRLW